MSRRCALPMTMNGCASTATRPRSASPTTPQTQLGDVVFVELPEIGRKVEQGKEAAVVEWVKAASEVYAPVSGEVTAVNDALAAEPAKVNADPKGEGWFFKLHARRPKAARRADGRGRLSSALSRSSIRCATCR